MTLLMPFLPISMEIRPDIYHYGAPLIYSIQIYFLCKFPKLIKLPKVTEVKESRKLFYSHCLFLNCTSNEAKPKLCTLKCVF